MVVGLEQYSYFMVSYDPKLEGWAASRTGAVEISPQWCLDTTPLPPRRTGLSLL